MSGVNGVETGAGQPAAVFDERVIVRELAVERNKHFVNRPSNRPLAKGYEEVGVWGEWEFGKWSGLMPKLTAGGDGGYDFVLPVYYKVDVKTSRRGDALLVEVGRVKADIYVLAKYEQEENEACATTLLGWTTKETLLTLPPTLSPRGIVNHVTPVENLRPMTELKKLLSRPR